MTFHASGLAAAPSWCPKTSFLRDHPERDPCEIAYQVDIPVLGRSEVKIPLNQMINDIRLQLDQDLPGIVSHLWAEAGPQIVADIEEEVMRAAPDVARRVTKEVVLPTMEQELEKAMAQAEVLRDEALKAALAMGFAVIGAVGLAAWWIKKG